MGDALAAAYWKAQRLYRRGFRLCRILAARCIKTAAILAHTGDIPHANKHATLRDALLEITRKNLGMTVICDESMKIDGIHRRRFTSRSGYGRRYAPVGDRRGDDASGHSRASRYSRCRCAEFLNAVLAISAGCHGDQLPVLHMHDLLRAGVVETRAILTMSKAGASLATLLWPRQHPCHDQSGEYPPAHPGRGWRIARCLIYMGNNGEAPAPSTFVPAVL